MSKVVYREFLGNHFFFLLLCLTGVGIPLALLYLMESMVSVHQELENPSQYLEKWRSRHR